MGTEVLSPPFLKGDLGGLSGAYLIPPAPLEKRRVILSQLKLLWLRQNDA
jgi:hypothetical protein